MNGYNNTELINAELSCMYNEINASVCEGFVIKGINGRDGKDGRDGVDGKDGKDGFSPNITVAEDSDTEYKLKITNESGSFITPNLKGKDGDDGEGSVDLHAGENIDITDNVISVLTTNNAEKDNTRPITSAGVNTIVGNIDILLKLI